MIEIIHAAAPDLARGLASHPYLTDADALWAALERLLRAHAPSGGAWLPGAIVDDIAAIAAELGLRERFIGQIGATGNAALWLGADKAQPDVVILAHMDRPSFRVDVRSGTTVYPICANRFPQGDDQVPAKALRFTDGKLQVSARGTLFSSRAGDSESLDFSAAEGEVGWQDTLVIDAEPQRDGTAIRGTGLDNCLGVITALGAAKALSAIEDQLRGLGRRCLFVFTDQEEGLPEAFFGHGAARLAGVLPAPSRGVIISDTQGAGHDGPPVIGSGASHGGISSWSKGSVVPPNYLALAVDLAASVNAFEPGTVQINTGYLSRSDDMAAGRWAQILGMIGAPMINAHTDAEAADLTDVQHAITWLSYFTTAVLGTVPKLDARFALPG